MRSSITAAKPRRLGVLLAVVALHALVLHAWLTGRAVGPQTDRVRRSMTVQLIEPAPESRSHSPATRLVSAAKKPAHRAPAVVMARRPGVPSNIEPQAAAGPAGTASTESDDRAADALDLGAGMRAVARSMAREHAVPWHSRASAPGLGDAIAASALPDCRTSRAALGLLALPLLAIDLARDRCGR